MTQGPSDVRVLFSVSAFLLIYLFINVHIYHPIPSVLNTILLTTVNEGVSRDVYRPHG